MLFYCDNEKIRRQDTCGIHSRREDLNLRPTDYKSVALPTELRRRNATLLKTCVSVNQHQQLAVEFLLQDCQLVMQFPGNAVAEFCVKFFDIRNFLFPVLRVDIK